MFASRFGREWSFDYLAGDTKNTEWIRRWTEHEVIVAPGVDTEAANWALAQALRVLDGRELEPWESSAALADRVAESMEPIATCPTCGKPHDHVHACGICGQAEMDDGKPFVPCCEAAEADRKAAREVLDAVEPEAGEPFRLPDGQVLDGYVAGECGHRVARSEWNAGFRKCERC